MIYNPRKEIAPHMKTMRDRVLARFPDASIKVETEDTMASRPRSIVVSYSIDAFGHSHFKQNEVRKIIKGYLSENAAALPYLIQDIGAVNFVKRTDYSAQKANQSFVDSVVAEFRQSEVSKEQFMASLSVIIAGNKSQKLGIDLRAVRDAVRDA